MSGLCGNLSDYYPACCGVNSFNTASQRMASRVLLGSIKGGLSPYRSVLTSLESNIFPSTLAFPYPPSVIYILTWTDHWYQVTRWQDCTH